MSILSKQKLPTFDPANHEHREVYAKFLVTGNFEQKFYIEVPQYHNMLDMIRAKLAEHACAPIMRRLKRDAERARLKAERELEALAREATTALNDAQDDLAVVTSSSAPSEELTEVHDSDND